MRSWPAVFGSVLLAAGCDSAPLEQSPRATAASAASAESAPPPEDAAEAAIRRLADRELPLPSPTTVNGTGYSFAATGSKVTPSPFEDGVSVTMDLGTSEPVTCVVYATPSDAGTTLRHMVQSVFGKGSAARVIPGAVEVAGDRPVQRLDVLYRKATGGDNEVSVMKLAWIGDFAHPALCYQDELGYARLFTDVARRVAETLVTEGAPSPDRVEIVRTTLGEVPVGFDYMGEWLEHETAPVRRKRVTYSLTALPMGPSLRTQDVLSTVHYDDAARIQDGHWAASSDDALVLNVNVARTSRGHQVTGSSRGKPLNALLRDFPEGLPDIRLTPELGKVATETTPFERTRQVYAPLVDPLALLAEKVVHETPGKLTLERGEESTQFSLGSKGNVESWEVRRGDKTARSEVLLARDRSETGQ